MASTPEVAFAGGKTSTAEASRVEDQARRGFLPGVNFVLRILLLATSVSALVVLVTSKQTATVPVLVQPQFPIFVTTTAKFNHSPAFTYLLVALAVACLYSIITVMASASFMSKSAASSRALFQLMVFDLFMLAIMASATGASASIAYVGLKGNSHVMWNKVCNVFDKFCRHVGSSTLLALVASVILLFLVVLSSSTIYRRSY
ncbi:hypothetical protein HPP92_017802 [Vanilla planifolia]|uniref:CASP-like protein n=1 Tax=Vanilla planifolia TaxID=51239 RepID=A0A835QDG2_VANPL|nr:hypothetical protein HPP92_018398 [Vanilla planifolia]KAG0468474.1 hypothetical protein HPP92_017802 [Vanilla planifolia]